MGAKVSFGRAGLEITLDWFEWRNDEFWKGRMNKTTTGRRMNLDGHEGELLEGTNGEDGGAVLSGDGGEFLMGNFEQQGSHKGDIQRSYEEKPYVRQFDGPGQKQLEEEHGKAAMLPRETFPAKKMRHHARVKRRQERRNDLTEWTENIG